MYILCKKGDDIAVLNLKGDIKTNFGHIYIFQIPSIGDGGSRNVDLVNIKKLLDEKSPDRLGLMGTSAKVVARKIGMDSHYDVDVIQSSISAALRSLDVAILTTGKMADRAIKKINENNLCYNRDIKCDYYTIPKKEEIK